MYSVVIYNRDADLMQYTNIINRVFLEQYRINVLNQ